MRKGNKKLVYVAMSGGVDSSVAAALLKKREFDVVGVYIKCWSQDEECRAVDDQEDARRVAAKLNIPFYTFNFEKEYRDRVVEYMIEGYKKGITPNPDVMCNREIKFGLFLEKTLKLGADYVATGHYVRKSKINPRKSKILYKLLKGVDSNKDQSYFLWTLTQNQLRRCLFPVGEYTKSRVRELAKEFGLNTADKKDSQGVCFIGDIDFQEFLRHNISKKKGSIVRTDGAEVGEHEGVYFYTIGQRRGIKVGGGAPYYVAEKDVKTNVLTVAVGDRDPVLYKKETAVCDLSWIRKPGKFPVSLYAKIRYRQPDQACRLKERNNKSLCVEFKEEQRAVAPGQSIVFYSKEGELLGGGTIIQISKFPERVPLRKMTDKGEKRKKGGR